MVDNEGGQYIPVIQGYVGSLSFTDFKPKYWEQLQFHPKRSNVDSFYTKLMTGQAVYMSAHVALLDDGSMWIQQQEGAPLGLEPEYYVTSCKE